MYHKLIDRQITRGYIVRMYHRMNFVHLALMSKPPAAVGGTTSQNDHYPSILTKLNETRS